MLQDLMKVAYGEWRVGFNIKDRNGEWVVRGGEEDEGDE